MGITYTVCLGGEGSLGTRVDNVHCHQEGGPVPSSRSERLSGSSKPRLVGGLRSEPAELWTQTLGGRQKQSSLLC